MHIDLAQKKYLVTGGTSVLGFHIAERILKEGGQVLFTYFENKQKAKELSKKGGRALFLDLRKNESLLEIKKRVKEEWSYLDGVILNAGIVKDKTIGNMTEDDFDDVLQVNLKANFLLIKQLLPLLYKSEQGKVIAVSSRVGFQGAFGEANYAAAKAGLIAFMKSLAREVGRKKILVNSIAPSFMISKMTEGLPEEIYEKQRQASLIGELGIPEEVANFIFFLLSDMVTQVTGQVFCVDSRKTKIPF